MSPEEIGGFIGRSVVTILWLYIVGLAIWKSFKRKNTLWMIILGINFIISLFLPRIVGAILPSIYLIKYYNAIKREKIKKQDKKIIKCMLVLVIVMFIVSCSDDTGSKVIVEEQAVNIKSDSNLKTIQTEEDSLESKKDNCIVEAEKLVPDYILISKEATRSRMFQRLDSEWKDGTPISIFNLGMPRGTTEDGQNVNYKYPNERYLIQYPPKQILDSEGVILGTNSFIFHPTVIEDHRNVIFGIDFDQDNLIVNVNWTGFDEEIKRLINRDELSFEVYFNNDRIHIGALTKENYNDEDLICNWTSSDEEGEHTCDVPRLQSINTLTQPDLIDSYLFEILNYTISDCNWIG